MTENTTTNEAQMKSNKVEEKTPTGAASSSKTKYSGRNENDEDENDEFYDSESEPSFIDSPEKSSSSSPPSNHQQQIPQTPVSLKSHQQTITFYAVQFSTDESAKKAVSTSNGNNSRIFCNKENAMKLCKLDPENRTFKAIVIHYLFDIHHRHLISADFRFKGIHELQRSVYIQFRGKQQ